MDFHNDSDATLKSRFLQRNDEVPDKGGGGGDGEGGGREMTTQFVLDLTITTAAPGDTVLSYQDILVGCCFAISGNLLISISLNLQKYTHMKNSQLEYSRHYLKDPMWWLGLLLMGLGELGNFSAYGYAPASLVAPLGTTAVVANIFLAALILKERIRPEHLFGSALAIVGACLLVTFAPKKERILDGEEITHAITEVSFIVYVCIELAALAGLFILLYWMQMNHVIVYLLITAVTASFTVISAKAVSSMLHLSMSGSPQFHFAIFYIMILVMLITIIVQIKYLNLAMKNFNATVVVPTNFVFFTISAILAGIIFYKEFFGMSVLDICMFLFGCLMSFVGVYFVTGNRLFEPPDDTKLITDDAEKPISPSVPSWLTAKIHHSPVQPKGASNHHLSDADRNTAPEVSTSSSSDSFGSQDTLFEKHTKTAAKHYGTNY